MKVDQVQFTIEQIHRFSDGRFNLIWHGQLGEVPHIGSLIKCSILQGKVEAVVHYINSKEYSEFEDFTELVLYSEKMGIENEGGAKLSESVKVDPSLIQRVVVRLEKYKVKERYPVVEIFKINPRARLLFEIAKIHDDEFRQTVWRRRKSHKDESVDFRIETK